MAHCGDVAPRTPPHRSGGLRPLTGIAGVDRVGDDDADTCAGRTKGGSGLLIARGGPTVTTNPVAVFAFTVIACEPSGVTQRSPTLNIEPSLLARLAGGTSASML